MFFVKVIIQKNSSASQRNANTKTSDIQNMQERTKKN